jgi:serine/threonine protein kinase
MPNPPNEHDIAQNPAAAADNSDTLAYKEGVPEAVLDAARTPFNLGRTVAAPVEPATTRSLVGQSFDDLELLAELGRGGMGLVYKARQKSLDRMVAVKLLLAEHYVDPTRLARFQAEARAAASLTHPNIVQVYQVGVCNLGHYFAMEFIDGRSLESFIYKGNTSVEAAVSVMIVVAGAVHYAHSKGIVHRDLKPANIMIDRTKRPVVMDFGIAKFVGKTSSLTQQGVVMGTPAYMAPEQAAGTPDEVGPHSDVYSLGAILYTLLAGRMPYEEETPLKTVLKVIGPDLPPPISKFRPNLPKALGRIVSKCMSKKPADRFTTANDFARALRRFRAGKEDEVEVEAKPPASERTTPAMTVTLVSRTTGEKLQLVRDNTTIGRSPDSDVVMGTTKVSKHHCRITIQGDGVHIEDLGSANGTFVNNKRISRATLADRDLLRIASNEFLVRIQKAEAGQD